MRRNRSGKRNEWKWLQHGDGSTQTESPAKSQERGFQRLGVSHCGRSHSCFLGLRPFDRAGCWPLPVNSSVQTAAFSHLRAARAPQRPDPSSAGLPTRGAVPALRAVSCEQARWLEVVRMVAGGRVIITAPEERVPASVTATEELLTRVCTQLRYFQSAVHWR